jgi:polyisoprenyl-phosphate glycosyltransferase
MLCHSKINVSIVIPVYFNEGNLNDTFAELRKVVMDVHPDRRFEVIFVDDGSGDKSLEVLFRLREQNPGIVRVIKLTRNFGQVFALEAGFRACRGEFVVEISADGQDPAAVLNEMIRGHYEEKYDVVIATRAGRDESLERKMTSRVFYSLVRRLSFPQMPNGGFDFVSMSRRALEVFLRNTESHPFFQGQILWMGFRTKFVSYQRRRRVVGTSRWGFARRLTYLIDGVLSYSYFPLRCMSVLGLMCSFLGFLYAIIIFVAKILGGVPVEGWAPLMIVILMLSGIQMLMLGIIGEYLWRTLAQVRGRDRYVIDQIFD